MVLKADAQNVARTPSLTTTIDQTKRKEREREKKERCIDSVDSTPVENKFRTNSGFLSLFLFMRNFLCVFRLARARAHVTLDTEVCCVCACVYICIIQMNN